MSNYDYPTAELEPRKLSKEEVEDPYQVIHGLFSYGQLPDLRIALWEWLKITVTGKYHKESDTDRSNLIYLYEKIEQLVEAVHIIHLQKANNIQPKNKEN